MAPKSESLAAEELSATKRALIEIRQLRAELEESKRARREPVAIVGMALRLPGGVDTPERFWEALSNGEDLISKVPADRWDASEFLDTDPDHPGTMYEASGGFISDVDAFDADFFGINAREAASMDPQQRLLLELAWEALERAAIDPKTLANTPTSVYIGLSGSDYGRRAIRDKRDIHAYSAVGSALSIAAGRISYFLGLRGPSMVIDTACSSSLVAVHLACESLRTEKTSLAIVGGSNLILLPDFNVCFSKTHMLAKDGRSKTFDAAADGYVRSEGCCVVVLKRLSDALRDEDRILACIAGSAVNQDGRSAGITAPNGPSQEAVIRAALENSGLDAAAVSYVETHGTGTPLGDPIEAQALGAVYGAARAAADPLLVGSVKTNLGHAEAAAGLIGLIKVVLMMQAGNHIVPHLHFRDPNPNIDFEKLHVAVNSCAAPWPHRGQPIHAGVSSFGFSGTNAHVLLSSVDAAAPARSDPQDREWVLSLSATTEVALRNLALRFVPFLQNATEPFSDICFTAATGRASFAHRLALRARTAAVAASMLERWLRGDTVEGLATNVSGPAQIESRDTLGKQLVGYVTNGDRSAIVASLENEKPCRVSLPVYPFERTRFWFGLSPEEERAGERENAWRSVIAESERQSLTGPLNWRLDRYPEKWALLERLTQAHARNVLASSGALREPASVEDVMERTGIRPIYQKIIARWMNGLVAAGALIREGDRFKAIGSFAPVALEPCWSDLERLFADEPGFVAYMKRCGALLEEVLKGRISPLETLFVDGSFELADALYETGNTARYFNSVVAAAVATAARAIGSRRNARILEIGGGGGGTTSAVFPLLPEGQFEYWFTDLSTSFLARGRKRFSARPFMHYAIFDLDRSPEEQGFGAEKFDVIVAANVVHVARDVQAALTRMHDLLAPGGTLVMLESTQNYSWFDITMGLMEGWQHFTDDRKEYPLLNAEQWKGALQANGFSEVVIIPSGDSPSMLLGQHVLISRSATATWPLQQSDGRSNRLVQRGGERELEPLEAAGSNVARKLQALSEGERELEMLDFVKKTIVRVFDLSVSAAELGERDRLSDLGMDSLIALELRGQLAKGLGCEGSISSTIAFDTGTVGELARALLQSINCAADVSEPRETAPRSSDGIGSVTSPRYRSTPASFTAEELNEKSDAEVEQLLNERLGRR